MGDLVLMVVVFGSMGVIGYVYTYALLAFKDAILSKDKENVMAAGIVMAVLSAIAYFSLLTLIPEVFKLLGI